DPVELDYVLKAFKSPQALYYFYFKTKKTADKHDFHRVCRQSESREITLCSFLHPAIYAESMQFTRRMHG
ncbi:hypothetical protein, partial [Cytobacillus firmus]|uniref:hypothetical protein n=1 Tax=Cytobacillus firmus TaxID=1399 RepID=UPI002162DB17